MVRERKLETILEEVAEYRIKDMDVNSTKDLLGMCYGNAYYLSVRLDNEGIDNTVMCVGIKRKFPDNYKPSSADDADGVDCQHFLVYVGENYYCEVSSEVKGEKYGRPAIWKNMPDDFKVFEDSYSFGNLDPHKRTRGEGKYS